MTDLAAAPTFTLEELRGSPRGTWSDRAVRPPGSARSDAWPSTRRGMDDAIMILVDALCRAPALIAGGRSG